MIGLGFFAVGPPNHKPKAQIAEAGVPDFSAPWHPQPRSICPAQRHLAFEMDSADTFEILSVTAFCAVFLYT